MDHICASAYAHTAAALKPVWELSCLRQKLTKVDKIDKVLSSSEKNRNRRALKLAGPRYPSTAKNLIHNLIQFQSHFQKVSLYPIKCTHTAG